VLCFLCCGYLRSLSAHAFCTRLYHPNLVAWAYGIQARVPFSDTYTRSIFLTEYLRCFSAIRLSMGGSGIVLCAFGLLYGGYWRIRVRRRFNLPASTWCCGQPNMTDCTQWFFCSLCSLCQEVRTAEAFHVIDDKFYHKEQPKPHSPGYEGKSPAPDVLLNPVPAPQMQPNLDSNVGKINQSEPAQRTTLTPPPTQSVEP
jgi:Cys-rich protein (TIGR01571 family)